MEIPASNIFTQPIDDATAIDYINQKPFIENKIVSQSSKGRIENITEADWLCVRGAALYLRMLSRNGSPCTQRVRNLVSQGRLPFYKPFGRLLFKRSELKYLIESSRKGGAR